MAAIRAYQHRPMYTKVARMFNCSWEQIKNIITNSDAIMEFYEATKNQNEQNVQDEQQMDQRQRKIKFLGECVYEAIKRMHYHLNLPVTEELIRVKAMEFQDFIKLDDFVPNKKWLNVFKSTYNISLANKHLSLTRAPPPSTDLRDIMTYCTKNRLQNSTNSVHMKDLKQKYNSLDAQNAEYESRRVRKLNFLQRALKEYLQRAQFHHKTMKLDDVALQIVAHEFNDILKVQDFHPTLAWIRHFRQRHNAAVQDNSGNAKRPLLSLDLKDILSYCSRMDNKTKACTITLKPKVPPPPSAHMMPPKFSPRLPDSKLKFQQNPIIYLDDEEEEKDIKPDINEIKVENHNETPTTTTTTHRIHMPPKFPSTHSNSKIKFQQSSIIYLDNDEEEKDVKPDVNEIILERSDVSEHMPPLKIRKIESINNDPVLQKELRQQHQKENHETQRIEEEATQKTCSENCTIKQEAEEDHANIVANNIPTLVRLVPREQTSKTTTTVQNTSPKENSANAKTFVIPQPSFNSSNSDEDSELPRQISNFKDALRLLKPLEEYAMLRENYRAIGLITQLEEVLKNSQENTR